MKTLLKSVKSQCLLLILSTAFCVPFKAIAAGDGGGGSTGGGDLCEDRIKVIRDDLKSWIVKGGPEGLQLLPGQTVAQYTTAMLSQIKTTHIKCVGKNDIGFPVEINHNPKVCKFDNDGQNSQITCDFDKFNSTDKSDQYVLVHHEFAGLAQLETPWIKNSDDSDYRISNQISGYLVDTIVRKLAVKPSKAPPAADIEYSRALECKLKKSTNKQKTYFFKAFTLMAEIVDLAGIGNSDSRIPALLESGDGNPIFSAVFIGKSFFRNNTPQGTILIVEDGTIQPIEVSTNNQGIIEAKIPLFMRNDDDTYKNDGFAIYNCENLENKN